MADNYEITKRRVQRLFPDYDHEAMARRFGLRLTERYLEVTLLNRPYRIDRATGDTRWSEDGFVTAHEAGFDEVLTLMDVLCDSRPDCRLSGCFCCVNDLDGVVQGTRLGTDFYVRYARAFDRDIKGFNTACEALGGRRLDHADAAWELPLFPFLPVRLQLWQSDEEFPVSMRILFDRNLLMYMRYETSYYATGHLLDRILERMSTTCA